MGLVENGLRQFTVEPAVKNSHDVLKGRLGRNKMPRRVSRDKAECQGLASQPERCREPWRKTGLMAGIDELVVRASREA